MPDEDYYTVDTKSVASKIDVSELRTDDDDGDGDRSFEWQRPVAYLLYLLFLVLAYLLADLWLGIELPFVP